MTSRSLNSLPVRVLRSSAVLVLGLALATCATGRTPPPATAMAKVATGLTFQFGLGDRSCGIPSPECPKDVDFKPALPELQVKLQPFEIDVHEVTNEQYDFCVEMDLCSLPAGDNGPNGIPDYYTADKYKKNPVIYVTWVQAQEYCASVGKRMPTEFEWERVAGGAGQTSQEKFLYPWEKGPDAKLAENCDRDVNLARCVGGIVATRAVTVSKADVVEVDGVKVFDLTGNVSEWTASDADDEIKKISATCDFTQTYQCESCTQCVAKKPVTLACKTTCQTCKCGAPVPAGSAEQCYRPCGTPICPRYPKSALPVLKGFPAKNVSPQRVVRGGSFFSHPPSVAQCDGRSDARFFTRQPGAAPLDYIGFRCARDLK